MIVHFPKDRVQKLLAHAKAAPAWRMLWKQPETSKPGLWMVGDQGVYLMNNANPGLLADGVSVRDDKAPEHAHAYVAYAREIDPERLAFDEWWHNKRQAFGGDDGSDFISAEEAEKWIANTAGEWLEMDLTPKNFSLVFYTPAKAPPEQTHGKPGADTKKPPGLKDPSRTHA